MGKISTYGNVGTPQLSDKLIGTKVGGNPADATFNFTLQSLLGLFSENITLQNVLDAGNTATQNIFLTGDISLSKITPESIEDETSSVGTDGQFLKKTATGILWDDIVIPTPPTPTLDEVLTAGNVSLLDVSIGTLFLYNPHAGSGNGYVSISGNKNRINFYDNTSAEIGYIGQDTLFLNDFSTAYGMSIKKPITLTNNRTATFQDADGTVAYLSDIPVITAQKLGEFINSLDSKTDVKDTDEFVLSDSDDGLKSKKTRFLDLKTKLKSYFDTFYLSLSVFDNFVEAVFDGFDNKLDKSTTASSVYGTNTAGGQTMIPFSTLQPTLISGTNIKTLEGQSLLGSGNINLTSNDVGLGNVDNTSDLNKPISTATQTALDLKENVANKATDLLSPDNTKYPTTLAVANENKKATITVELINQLTTDFYAPNALIINSTALISGSGTLTLKVNDIAYTLGNLIPQGAKITAETTSQSVYNLISVYE
jgi:hypothetical protein